MNVVFKKIYNGGEIMSYQASNYQIQELANSFERYSTDYVNNLRKVEAIVEDVKNGHMTGKPADDFVKLFVQKQDAFKKIENSINDFNKLMENEVKRFNNMISKSESEMR